GAQLRSQRRQVPPKPPGSRSASSRCIPCCDRAPEDGEGRVERDRAPEPAPCLRLMAEAAQDHPAVEELERVLRSEPESGSGVRERGSALAVPRQRPSEHVVAVDRRPIVLPAPG